VNRAGQSVVEKSIPATEPTQPFSPRIKAVAIGKKVRQNSRFDDNIGKQLLQSKKLIIV